jgi:hypothetical protein
VSTVIPISIVRTYKIVGKSKENGENGAKTRIFWQSVYNVYCNVPLIEVYIVEVTTKRQNPISAVKIK